MKARIPGTKPDRSDARTATICDLLSFFDAFAARSVAGEAEKRRREAGDKARPERSGLAS
jgi:hypothetical protein